MFKELTPRAICSCKFATMASRGKHVSVMLKGGSDKIYLVSFRGSSLEIFVPQQLYLLNTKQRVTGQELFAGVDTHNSVPLLLGHVLLLQDFKLSPFLSAHILSSLHPPSFPLSLVSFCMSTGHLLFVRYKCKTAILQLGELAIQFFSWQMFSVLQFWDVWWHQHL